MSGKNKINEEIKKLKASSGVEWPPVAGYLGISEGTLFRWLRHPMNKNRENQIRDAIINSAQFSEDEDNNA